MKKGSEKYTTIFLIRLKSRNRVQSLETIKYFAKNVIFKNLNEEIELKEPKRN